MGFFNGILKSLGFEGENAEKVKSEKSDVVKKPVMPTAVYSLDESKRSKKNAEYKTFVPKNQQEVQSVIANLKKGEVVLVDFEHFADADIIRALDFLSGVICTISGKIQKVNSRRYILYPYC